MPARPCIRAIKTAACRSVRRCASPRSTNRWRSWDTCRPGSSPGRTPGVRRISTSSACSRISQTTLWPGRTPLHLENRMSARRALIPIALTLLAVGCSDERQPIGVPPTPTPHVLRWAGHMPPQFIAPDGGVVQSASRGVMASLTGGLSLDNNVVTFWAVRGEARSVQINYLSSTGDTSFPFLHLTITDPGYMNGDGVVDEGDAQIETSLLGLWYREGADSAWAQIPASQSIGDKSFISALRHFCEYEVSYFEYAVSW